MRQFAITDVKFGTHSMNIATIVSDWGEDDSIVGDSLKQGYDETESIAIWRYLSLKLQNESLAIDVGAYVGFYSIIATLSNPNIRCLAFEPSAATYGRLLTNILLNSIDTRVIPCHLAAGNKPGMLELKHRYGVFSITSGDSAVFDFKEDHSETITSITLDSLIESEGHPGVLGSKAIPLHPFSDIGLIKIDVEGAELSVLEGAQSLIEKYHPTILAEALDEEAEKQLEDFATRNKYSFDKIAEERNVLMMPQKERTHFLDDYQTWKQQQSDLSLRFERKLTFTV